MFSKLPIVLSVTAGLVSAATWDVSVSNANGDLTYTPPFLTGVQNGDVVNFHFWPKNHTVTQSSFSAPCTPLDGGADAGFHPVAPGTPEDALPVVPLTVSEADHPLWFYCRQPGPPRHCTQGMVFAINPSTDPNGNTFDKFHAAALALNTDSTTTAPPSTSTSFLPPPPPQTVTVTQTVSAPNGSVYTTTYASWSGSPANPTPAAQPVVHTVDVGEQGLTFTPSQLTAEIGDTVRFTFHPKAHSVTQSTFNSPCQPKAAGFDSGLMPVTNDTNPLPTFQFIVNDTNPVWVYCKQQGPPVHCQQGMVFAVNAPVNGPNNFTAFQSLAIHSADLAVNVTSTAPTSTVSQGGQGGNGAASTIVSPLALILGVVLSAFL